MPPPRNFVTVRRRARPRRRTGAVLAPVFALLLGSGLYPAAASAQARPATAVPAGSAVAAGGAVTAGAADPAGTPGAADTLAGVPSARASGVVMEDVRFGTRSVLHTLSAPARWSTDQWLLVPGTGIAAAVLIQATDGPVEHFEDRRRLPGLNLYFDVVEPLGQYGSFGVVAAMYGGGLVLHRPALRRTAVEALAASVVAGGVVTPLIKLAVGRARPRQELGPYAFAPFSGDESFPSGHTTQAFAVASVIAAESSSPWVGVLAYGLAGSVGAARIYHDAHFLSDVAVGAAIGTLVGHSVVAAGGATRGTLARPYVAESESGGVALGLSLPFQGSAPAGH